MEPDIFFCPEVVFVNINHDHLTKVDRQMVNNMAFHLGLMEIPSYWKATCSPEIEIKAGILDEFQISWWQRLFFKGLGEFFYINNIKPFMPRIINSIHNNVTPFKPFANSLDDGFLVPVGGGKDSAVACELLKKADKRAVSWCLNPTKAIQKEIKLSGLEKGITVLRSIDKTLIKLNKESYLNGHTPFSAYLAFASSFCAILSGHRNIAISNERSSNEGNVMFNDIEINHQYSKSFEFETKFRDYSTRYLARDINYFSILRPLYEIQISKLFSLYRDHFSTFKSCNREMKTDSWCCNCPKCLFVFTVLFPFIDESVLVKSIFSKNLFDDKNLIKTALHLLGSEGVKPFECVGTKDETVVAFYLCIKKIKEKGGNLPVVLCYIIKNLPYDEQYLDELSVKLMHSWNEQHNVPDDIEKTLRTMLN